MSNQNTTLYILIARQQLFNAIKAEYVTSLPPATKLGQGNIFRSMCPHSVHGGGHVWLLGGMRGCLGVHGCSGGHVWLLRGEGGVPGCSREHVWLLQGGMHGCSGGACMVALGGHAWLLWGVCMG